MLSQAVCDRYIHGVLSCLPWECRAGETPTPTKYPASSELSTMSRRRFVAASIAIAVVLCVTGAWAYYKLAGAGESMLEEANKFLGTFSGEQKAKVAIGY